MTRQELIEKLSAGERDFSHLDFSGLDFRGCDLRGHSKGQGLNFSYCDFSKANLSGQNLFDLDLRHACFMNAILDNSNLAFARLDHSSLQRASLRLANLSRARLSYCCAQDTDFLGANLEGASLRGTDLEHATGLKYLAPIPETGEFIAWKLVSGGGIVKLRIPADAKRTGCYKGRKCRASKVEVLEGEGVSMFNNSVTYAPGFVLEVSNFDSDPSIECAPGIHFFMTEQEALDYLYY